jgi:superoxide dismutase, Fe-Mn family
MAFTLPPLPYDRSALEPHMSAKTLEFHYGKHHQAYVTNLNNLVKNTPFASKSIEAVIGDAAKDESTIGLFNNAAQVWNHTFFWNSMKPNGGGAPAVELTERMNRDFGGFAKFKELFKQAAVGQFGSGWAWLVVDKSVLRVTKTSDAMTPIVLSQTPLLTCDVWEHAYYLDYQNRRPDFVQTFLDRLVDWDFVAMNLKNTK